MCPAPPFLRLQARSDTYMLWAGLSLFLLVVAYVAAKRTGYFVPDALKPAALLRATGLPSYLLGRSALQKAGGEGGGAVAPLPGGGNGARGLGGRPLDPPLPAGEERWRVERREQEAVHQLSDGGAPAPHPPASRGAVPQPETPQQSADPGVPGPGQQQEEQPEGQQAAPVAGQQAASAEEQQPAEAELEQKPAEAAGQGQEPAAAGQQEPVGVVDQHEQPAAAQEQPEAVAGQQQEQPAAAEQQRAEAATPSPAPASQPSPPVQQQLELRWHYVDGQKQKRGPLPESALRSLHQTQPFGPQQLFWRKGLKAWTPLRQLPELSAALEGGDGGAAAEVAELQRDEL